MFDMNDDRVVGFLAPRVVFLDRHGKATVVPLSVDSVSRNDWDWFGQEHVLSEVDAKRRSSPHLNGFLFVGWYNSDTTRNDAPDHFYSCDDPRTPKWAR